MADADEKLKDPDARLDYLWDWTPWLHEDEAITDQTVFVESGDVQLDGSPVHVEGKVIQWLTGGTDRSRARVTCRIETNQNRRDDRTMLIRVRHR